MREKEYPPLLLNGFKDIKEDDLHSEFVQPFNDGHNHRTNLLIDFGRFLNQFKALGIKAEIWIDGSFTTEAPDPSDVDVVFYFNPEEVDSLQGEKKQLFERLFTERKFIRNLYKVEVHYATKGNEDDYRQWQKTYGTFYDNVTPKGIFRLRYN